jgi:signal transduction histidine kinase
MSILVSEVCYVENVDVLLGDFQHITLSLTRQFETNPEQLRDVFQYIIAVGSSLRLQVDVDTLLREIAVAACKALRFRYSALYLSDARGHFRTRATAGVSEQGEAFLQDHPIPDQVVAMLINDDYRISDSYFFPAEAPIWQDREFAGYFFIAEKDDGLAPIVPTREPPSPSCQWLEEDLLVVPLVSGDNTLLGFLTPDAPLSGLRPTAEIMALFELFMNQAAVAIEGARLHADLRQALTQAQESERIKNQFLMTASHELRTPLTAIQGYIELLANYRAALDEATQVRFLHNARRACDELVLLLGNVMDASRVDQDRVLLKLAPMQVSQAAQAILEILEPIVAREKRAVSVCIPAAYVAWVDELRLRQVLLNLVGNALKYTPEGTPLELRAEHLTWQDLRERIPSHILQAPMPASGYFVVIAIRDWGPGIALEAQPQLFSKFVRLPEAINSMQRGAGLGLYLCRQLTEAMGGCIWLESAGIAGQGSAFFIALPLHHEPAS